MSALKSPLEAAADIRQALARAPLRGLARIVVKAEGTVISLLGEVRSFYEKQMATEYARRVAKSCRIENLVIVQAGPVHSHPIAPTHHSAASLAVTPKL